MTGVPHRMISSAAVSGRSRLEQLPLVGVVEEGLHAVGDRVAGGLVARHREHEHEVAELVRRQLLAVDLRVDQLGDDVVARVHRPVLGHLHGVGEQLHRRLDPRRSNSGSSPPTIWLDHWKIFFRSSCGNADQLGDRLQRQLAGHVRDEVAGSLGQRRGDDPLGAHPQVVLACRGPPWA